MLQRSAATFVLVKAGVPLNATDDIGFTPLMHAARVDVGNVVTLKALLAADADRRIRNDERRTPLEANHYNKHAELVETLK